MGSGCVDNPIKINNLGFHFSNKDCTHTTTTSDNYNVVGNAAIQNEKTNNCLAIYGRKLGNGGSMKDDTGEDRFTCSNEQGCRYVGIWDNLYVNNNLTLGGSELIIAKNTNSGINSGIKISAHVPNNKIDFTDLSATPIYTTLSTGDILINPGKKLSTPSIIVGTHTNDSITETGIPTEFPKIKSQLILAGDTDSAYKIYCYDDDGSEDIFSVTNGGDVKIANDLTVTNDLTVVNKITYKTLEASSDIRLKKNIKPLINGLNVINKIPVKTYHWKDDTKSNKLQFGVIAQEVEKILPEIVSNSGEFKAVNYNALIPFLIKSVQEQQQLISTLYNRIDILEKNM